MPMGPTIGEHCPKTKIVAAEYELCPVHHSRLYKFARAAVAASVCGTKPCNAEIHRRSVGSFNIVAYELMMHGKDRHEQMVSIDAIISLHMGFLKPEIARVITSSLDEIGGLKNDSHLLEAVLMELEKGKKYGRDQAEVIAHIKVAMQARGMRFMCIGK